MEHEQQPQLPHPNLACLIVYLQELRDALEETALALSDYQCTVDSENRRAADLQVAQVIERAKAQGSGAGGWQ